MKRRTLARRVSLRGHGLFSGSACAVRLGPGEPGSGWRWRVDRAWHALEPIQLAPLPRRSRLVADADVLVLPEHLLAALLMADLDDVTIEVWGGEVPCLDGSAWPFVRALRHVVAPPASRSLTVVVDWRDQRVQWRGGYGAARARTFIGAVDAREARRGGLFAGARGDLALVLDERGDRLTGARGRRLPQEPAWHKLVDLLGDLAPHRALGPLRGRLWARDPSHDRNPALIADAFASGALVMAMRSAA